jgi:hypothetical protein
VALGKGRWIFMLMWVSVGRGGDEDVLVMRFWFQPQTREYSGLEVATFLCTCSDDGVFHAQLTAA